MLAHNLLYPTLEMQEGQLQRQPINNKDNFICVQPSYQPLNYHIQAEPQVRPYTMFNSPILVKQFLQIIGDIRVEWMMDTVSYLAAFTILITYIVCCSLGHEPWFPVMITSTGTSYPENIFFRIGLITSIFFWFIMVELEYYWLKAQCESLAGAVSIGYTQNVIAYIGFFFYSLTIATIDQGYTPTHIHGGCAVIFFVLLCIYNFMNFNKIKEIMKYKPNFISKESFNQKKLLIKAWYLVFFFIILLVLKYKWALAVAEWIGTYAIIFYLQTYALDMKAFYLNVNDEQYDLRLQLARNAKKQTQTEQPSVTSRQTSLSAPQNYQPQQLGYRFYQVPQGVQEVSTIPIGEA